VRPTESDRCLLHSNAKRQAGEEEREGDARALAPGVRARRNRHAEYDKVQLEDRCRLRVGPQVARRREHRKVASSLLVSAANFPY